MGSPLFVERRLLRRFAPEAAGFAARMLAAEGFDRAAILQGDEHVAAVRAAEGDVGGLAALQRNFAQQLARGRHDGDGAGTVARDEQVAQHVAAHAVEAVVVEGDQQALVGDATNGIEIVGPDPALHALIDVERVSVRRDLDAVGGAHAGLEQVRGAVGGDAPELAVIVGPARIAGVEAAVGCEGDVVGLVHARLVREHVDATRARVDAQDVVAGVVGDVHTAVRAEADAVADAAFRQDDEQFRTRASFVAHHATDGAVAAEVDHVQRAVGSGGGAFDTVTEDAVADMVGDLVGRAGEAWRAEKEDRRCDQ